VSNYDCDFFFFQAEDGIRDKLVTGVQTCALPISVDTDAFNAAMEQQKAKARASWAGSGEAATETIWFPLREKLGASEFLGYDTRSEERRVGKECSVRRASVH